MWAQPPGKSSKTRLNLLSGGEKSMAALTLIFAIQDYEPSPFYYFDEVDQNLDAFNAESIATLCKLRSQRAQFIMVTLRKVSLQLAEHHIGVTHAGDGCSRLIHDFDRDQAIEIGVAAERELEAQKLAEESRENMPELPKAENRPRVPEPLPTPKTLGGLDEDGLEAAKQAAAELQAAADISTETEVEEGSKAMIITSLEAVQEPRIGLESEVDKELESVSEPDVEMAEAESETIQSLTQRAKDWQEDIEEKIEWEQSVKQSASDEVESDSNEAIDEPPESPIEEVNGE
jgi:chromosome segregation protein